MFHIKIKPLLGALPLKVSFSCVYLIYVLFSGGNRFDGLLHYSKFVTIFEHFQVTTFSLLRILKTYDFDYPVALWIFFQ